MSFTMSTFGESSKPMEAAPAAAVQSTETTATETTTTTEVAAADTSATTVNNEGALQTPTATQADTAATDTDAIADVFEMKMPVFESANTDANAATSQTQATVNWEEAIKNIDPKLVLEKLGIDGFALEMNEHIKRGGKPVDYLYARAIDYNQVGDVDLLKEDFAKKYHTLSPEERDELFNDVYKQSEYDDDGARKIGAIRLKADAQQLRLTKIAEQQSFKIPEPAQQAQVQQQQPNQEEAIQQTRNFIQNHEATQSLIQSKRVAIPLGKEDSFRFSIDNPDFLIDVMTNKDTWAKVLSTKQGEPDMNRIIRAAKYIIDMDAHDNAIFNYGVQKGERKKVEGNQYVSKPVVKTGIPNNETLGQAFQTRAKVSTFGG